MQQTSFGPRQQCRDPEQGGQWVMAQPQLQRVSEHWSLVPSLSAGNSTSELEYRLKISTDIDMNGHTPKIHNTNIHIIVGYRYMI